LRCGLIFVFVVDHDENHLRKGRGVRGPHLVIVPKSVAGGSGVTVEIRLTPPTDPTVAPDPESWWSRDARASCNASHGE
jgi:hypothetical protein